MRVVPRDEVLEKLAAMQHADARGRQLAQDHAVEKLASMAGVFMVHSQHAEGIEKLAQSMVFSGGLSPEEYEILKEAGVLSLFAKKVGRKAVGAVAGAGKAVATGVGKAVTGVKSRVGNVVKRKAPKVSPNQLPKATTQAAAPRQVTPEVALRKATVQAVARKRAAPAVASPAAARQTTQQASQATQQTAKASQQAAKAAKQGTQTAAKSKGTGWGRALPYAGVGALGYGLYKGVPWAARQMEQTSTTPMAYGAGWSPVQYGYGQNRYGPSVATMGSGA